MLLTSASLKSKASPRCWKPMPRNACRLVAGLQACEREAQRG